MGVAACGRITGPLTPGSGQRRLKPACPPCLRPGPYPASFSLALSEHYGPPRRSLFSARFLFRASAEQVDPWDDSSPYMRPGLLCGSS